MLPHGYTENQSRDLEDLENKVNRLTRNLETLKKVVEDLYAKVEGFERQMFHLSNSTMTTALEVDKLVKNKARKS